MTTISGLPAHVLLVHAVVVVIPLCSVLLLLGACWPAARRRLAVPTAALAGLALILVPITTEAGEWLEHHLPRTPLMHTHTELGDYALPWAIALFVVAAAVAVRQVLGERREHGYPGGRVLTGVLVVLAVVVAVGATAVVYRIGESGAAAAWTGKFSATPVARPAAGS
jgi:hypothetical protein